MALLLPLLGARFPLDPGTLKIYIHIVLQPVLQGSIHQMLCCVKGTVKETVIASQPSSRAIVLQV